MNNFINLIHRIIGINKCETEQEKTNKIHENIGIIVELIKQQNDIQKENYLIHSAKINLLENNINDMIRNQIKYEATIINSLSNISNIFNKEISDNKSKNMLFSKNSEDIIKREYLNMMKQLEAFLNLQSIWRGEENLPPLHGWPISPDLAVLLVEQIQSERYDLIIEFGSGSSTLVMARLLKRLMSSVHLREFNIPRFVAFDHMDVYYKKTRDLIARAGVLDVVDLRLAPLVPYISNNGISYQYYDCTAALAEISAALKNKHLKILIFVDGPPSATGPLARYPALPIVMNYFDCDSVHVLLDDANRREEKDVINAWKEYLDDLKMNYESVDVPLEKGANIIRIFNKH